MRPALHYGVFVNGLLCRLQDRRFRVALYLWVSAVAAAASIALWIATGLISQRLNAEYRSDALSRAFVQACTRITRGGTWRAHSVESVYEPVRPPVLVHVDVTAFSTRMLQLTLWDEQARMQTYCPRPQPRTTREALTSASLAG